jgi:chromosome segregation and condensation protein ScpB
MDSQITEVDLEMLCKENPLANEQLRRIVAERQRAELLEEIKKLKEDDGDGISDL